jgi:hypothetical protein
MSCPQVKIVLRALNPGYRFTHAEVLEVTCLKEREAVGKAPGISIAQAEADAG